MGICQVDLRIFSFCSRDLPTSVYINFRIIAEFIVPQSVKNFNTKSRLYFSKDVVYHICLNLARSFEFGISESLVPENVLEKINSLPQFLMCCVTMRFLACCRLFSSYLQPTNHTFYDSISEHTPDPRGHRDVHFSYPANNQTVLPESINHCPEFCPQDCCFLELLRCYSGF